MARIRTIKPEFFSSRRIAHLSRDARITFIGIWTEADDYGICDGDAHVLKGHLWPFDDDITPADVERHLAEMTTERPRPLIRFFEWDGKRYIEVLGWEHQRVNRPSSKRHPSPPGQTHTPATQPGALTEPSLSPPAKKVQEVEVEVEVEQEVEPSSSNGPYHQELSTGRDDDDEQPSTSHTARARATADELGRRDSTASPTRRTAAPHAIACADNRWRTDRWALEQLAAAHPELTIIELADLHQSGQLLAQALHPAGTAPPSRPAAWTKAPADCPRCAGLSWHSDGVCQLLDDLTDHELDILNRTEEP